MDCQRRFCHSGEGGWSGNTGPRSTILIIDAGSGVRTTELPARGGAVEAEPRPVGRGQVPQWMLYRVSPLLISACDGCRATLCWLGARALRYVAMASSSSRVRFRVL